MKKEKEKAADGILFLYLVDLRGIALAFCEANAPNGKRRASQNASVTVRKTTI